MTKVSIDIEPIYRTGGSRRLGTLWAALVSLSLLLGARSTVPAWADPTGRFEEDVEASRSATGDGNAQSQSSSLPDLSAIPDLLLAASGSADTGPRYAINLQSTLEPVDAASVPPLPGFENLRLYATQIEKDGKVWHRLRLGFFDSESSARLALESLRGRYPRAWVTKVAPPAREGFARTSRGAALPSVAVAPGTTRILFTEDSIELSETAKAQLTSVAGDLLQDESARVELLAFAKSSTGDARVARRLSLTRALVVRAFLVDQGVPSTRMNVRSLADKIPGGPPDRVDIRRQSPGP